MFVATKKRILSFSKFSDIYSNPKGNRLMEKRLGLIAIVITNRESINRVNELISKFSDIFIARQGIPMHDRGLSFISLVVDAEMNRINNFTGNMGKLPGVEVKTIFTKQNESHN